MSTSAGTKEFLEALSVRSKQVRTHLMSKRYQEAFGSAHVRDSVYSYILAGGKLLRPGVLLFSCGAVGGEEKRAIPAAAGLEMFHTWTIVHDDIIDRDAKRRGGPTVHEEFRRRAIAELALEGEEAAHYGTALAILAGDVQHGWAISLFTELTTVGGLDPLVTLALVAELDGYVVNTLVEGQALDVQYAGTGVEAYDRDRIVDVLWRKTGVLYEFAGRAGAMIGLQTADRDHELVRAISSFTGKCGTAFQLQDDILGIVGDERQLGKPVGSDVREGKKTMVVLYAFQAANPSQRQQLTAVLGERGATDGEIERTRNLLIELGGIEQTQALAHEYVAAGLRDLETVPASSCRDLLCKWAEFVIERRF
ncbi:MAG: polyprenyl synthetase family protein [Candidatus Latescibacterota bacterium]